MSGCESTGAHPQHVHSVVVGAEVFAQRHQEFTDLHDTNTQKQQQTPD